MAAGGSGAGSSGASSGNNPGSGGMSTPGGASNNKSGAGAGANVGKGGSAVGASKSSGAAAGTGAKGAAGAAAGAAAKAGATAASAAGKAATGKASPGAGAGAAASAAKSAAAKAGAVGASTSGNKAGGTAGKASPGAGAGAAAAASKANAGLAGAARAQGAAQMGKAATGNMGSGAKTSAGAAAAAAKSAATAATNKAGGLASKPGGTTTGANLAGAAKSAVGAGLLGTGTNKSGPNAAAAAAANRAGLGTAPGSAGLGGIGRFGSLGTVGASLASQAATAAKQAAVTGLKSGQGSHLSIAKAAEAAAGSRLGLQTGAGGYGTGTSPLGDKGAFNREGPESAKQSGYVGPGAATAQAPSDSSLDLAAAIALGENATIRNPAPRNINRDALNLTLGTIVNRAAKTGDLQSAVTAPGAYSITGPRYGNVTPSTYADSQFGPKNPEHQATRATLAAMLAGDIPNPIGTNTDYGNQDLIGGPWGQIHSSQATRDANARMAADPRSVTIADALNPGQQHTYGSTSRKGTAPMAGFVGSPGFAPQAGGPAAFSAPTPRSVSQAVAQQAAQVAAKGKPMSPGALAQAARQATAGKPSMSIADQVNRDAKTSLIGSQRADQAMQGKPARGQGVTSSPTSQAMAAAAAQARQAQAAAQSRALSRAVASHQTAERKGITGPPAVGTSNQTALGQRGLGTPPGPLAGTSTSNPPPGIGTPSTATPYGSTNTPMAAGPATGIANAQRTGQTLAGLLSGALNPGTPGQMNAPSAPATGLSRFGSTGTPMAAGPATAIANAQRSAIAAQQARQAALNAGYDHRTAERMGYQAAAANLAASPTGPSPSLGVDMGPPAIASTDVMSQPTTLMQAPSRPRLGAGPIAASPMLGQAPARNPGTPGDVTTSSAAPPAASAVDEAAAITNVLTSFLGPRQQQFTAERPKIGLVQGQLPSQPGIQHNMEAFERAIRQPTTLTQAPSRPRLGAGPLSLPSAPPPGAFNDQMRVNPGVAPPAAPPVGAFNDRMRVNPGVAAPPAPSPAIGMPDAAMMAHPAGPMAAYMGMIARDAMAKQSLGYPGYDKRAGAPPSQTMGQTVTDAMMARPSAPPAAPGEIGRLMRPGQISTPLPSAPPPSDVGPRFRPGQISTPLPSAPPAAPPPATTQFAPGATIPPHNFQRSLNQAEAEAIRSQLAGFLGFGLEYSEMKATFAKSRIPGLSINRNKQGGYTVTNPKSGTVFSTNPKTNSYSITNRNGLTTTSKLNSDLSKQTLSVKDSPAQRRSTSFAPTPSATATPTAPSIARPSKAPIGVGPNPFGSLAPPAPAFSDTVLGYNTPPVRNFAQPPRSLPSAPPAPPMAPPPGAFNDRMRINPGTDSYRPGMINPDTATPMGPMGPQFPDAPTPSITMPSKPRLGAGPLPNLAPPTPPQTSFAPNLMNPPTNNFAQSPRVAAAPPAGPGTSVGPGPVNPGTPGLNVPASPPEARAALASLGINTNGMTDQAVMFFINYVLHGPDEETTPITPVPPTTPAAPVTDPNAMGLLNFSGGIRG